MNTSASASNTINPKNKQPTVLVMAGGTGGHIFPGLAVADELALRGWKIHWLGTAKRMEAELVPAHGYDISFINIAGLRNKNWQALIGFPIKMLQSLWQSIKVIHKVKPDVVIGMGGYASGPGGIAAWLTRKPLILHEQNAAAGMTNRYLARFSHKVLTAFPQAFSEKLSKKIRAEVIGNPLRKAFVDDINNIRQGDVNPVDGHANKNILIIGGSLGAEVLNETVPQALEHLKNINFKVWHQTGKGKISAVNERYSQLTTALNLHAKQIKVTEFIQDVAKAYQWADLVICRAGALTVSELAAAARPAIFVPLPHAVDDHQTKNAMFLANEGAAKIIAQKDFNDRSLSELLVDVLTDDAKLKNMAKSAANAARIHATQQVADICEQIANTKQAQISAVKHNNTPKNNK